MKTIRSVCNIVMLGLGYLMRRSRRKIIFGAWCGWSYSDNPKYLYEFFFQHPDWTIVWCGGEEVENSLPPVLPRHAKFCRKDSLRGLWHAVTASVWVFSHSTDDIANFPIWGRALLLDANHGIALKKVGVQCPSSKNGVTSRKSGLSIRQRIMRKLYAREIFLVMPSARQGRNVIEGFPGMFSDTILPFGSPTIDFIMANKGNIRKQAQLRAKYAQIFNLPLNKKWIVYAPTFRWTVSQNFSFTKISSLKYEKLASVLVSSNAIIVEKLHPRLVSGTLDYGEGLIKKIDGLAAKGIEPQELWLACDAIITDYSSAAFSFFFQGKPIIHFAYDLSYYQKEDAGLVAENMEDIKLGPIARSFDEVLGYISRLELCINIKGNLVPSLIEYEDGRSCEKYLAYLESRQK